MRFAFKICAATALCAAMLTQTAKPQSYTRAETSRENLINPSDLRRRAAGSAEKPVLPEGLYAERVASSIGHISAMLSTPDGSIYALGTESGQLFHFLDRGLDGRMDSRTTLAAGFDTLQRNKLARGLARRHERLCLSHSRPGSIPAE